MPINKPKDQSEAPTALRSSELVVLLAERWERTAEYLLRDKWDGPYEYMVKTTTAEALNMCAQELRAHIDKQHNAAGERGRQ